jgi:FkbM family methyltransferase
MPYFQQLADTAVGNFFKNFAKPGDVVFDVGANLGQSSELASLAVGSTGHVFSFEPNPVTFPILKAKVSRWPVSNVTALNLALSDSTGIVDFYVDMRPEFGSEGSSMRELIDLKVIGKSKKTSVRSSTLDAFCELGAIKPRVLKIDVESFEPQVIAGGRKTIEQVRPVILFEFWETWWNNGFHELFDYLTPMYTLVRMQDGINVDKWYHSNAGTGVSDILCLPR